MAVSLLTEIQNLNTTIKRLFYSEQFTDIIAISTEFTRIKHYLVNYSFKLLASGLLLAEVSPIVPCVYSSFIYSGWCWFYSLVRFHSIIFKKIHYEDSINNALWRRFKISDLLYLFANYFWATKSKFIYHFWIWCTSVIIILVCIYFIVFLFLPFLSVLCYTFTITSHVRQPLWSHH